MDVELSEDGSRAAGGGGAVDEVEEGIVAGVEEGTVEGVVPNLLG